MDKNDQLYVELKELEGFIWFLEGILKETEVQKTAIESMMKHFGKLEAKDPDSPPSAMATGLKGRIVKLQKHANIPLDDGKKLSNPISIPALLDELRGSCEEKREKLIAAGDPRVRKTED